MLEYCGTVKNGNFSKKRMGNQFVSQQPKTKRMFPSPIFFLKVSRNYNNVGVKDCHASVSSRVFIYLK
jgi:hypothetical protein